MKKEECVGKEFLQFQERLAKIDKMFGLLKKYGIPDDYDVMVKPKYITLCTVAGLETVKFQVEKLNFETYEIELYQIFTNVKGREPYMEACLPLSYYDNEDNKCKL